MRKGIRRTGLVLVLVLVVAPRATAQQTSPTGFLTGVTPQNMQFKPIDMSNMVTPPPVVPQPSSFSLTKLVSFFKLPNFSSIFSTNKPAPVFPGQQPDGFAPVLPTTMLPGQQPNAYNPLLPTTTLPTPPPNGYNPVLPTTTLPTPPPDAIHPLLPFTPNQ